MMEEARNAAPARRVVCFGDLRAAWWDVPLVPKLHCVAVGVPGAAIGCYLARCYQQMVVPLRPDRVVLPWGVNDLTGLPPSAAAIATTRDAILAVLAAAHELGAQMIRTTILSNSGRRNGE